MLLRGTKLRFTQASRCSTLSQKLILQASAYVDGLLEVGPPGTYRTAKGCILRRGLEVHQS